MRKNNRFRLKANELKGMMGGFKGRVDSALEKIGGSKSAKLDSLLQHMLSRIAVLKNQRRLRCAHGRGDIAELLNNGHRDLALLRAEYVLNEHNMLEALDIVQTHCNQLMENYSLLKHQKKCPIELKVTISSLIFVSSNCDELPELDEIRSIFSDKFGKEFVRSAIELQDGCQVNLDLTDKLSGKEISSEDKVKLLMEVASEKGIKLDLDQDQADKLAQIAKEAKNFISNLNLNLNQPTPPNSGANSGLSSVCSSEDDSAESARKTHKHYDATAYAGPSRQTIPRCIPKKFNGSGIESRVQSDNSEPEDEDEIDHGYIVNNAFELEKIQFLGGSDFSKLVSDISNDDTEEDKHNNVRTVLEPRRTKWQGFRMKRHFQFATEEDNTEQEPRHLHEMKFTGGYSNQIMH